MGNETSRKRDRESAKRQRREAEQHARAKAIVLDPKPAETFPAATVKTDRRRA